MTIHLTPEQERRIRAIIDRGPYKSVEEVVEAALTAVEQRTVPGFAGTPEDRFEANPSGLKPHGIHLRRHHRSRGHNLENLESSTWPAERETLE